ncbi:hypothetical protein K6H09_000099 [Candida tropicalis]
MSELNDTQSTSTMLRNNNNDDDALSIEQKTTNSTLIQSNSDKKQPEETDQLPPYDIQQQQEKEKEEEFVDLEAGSQEKLSEKTERMVVEFFLIFHIECSLYWVSKILGHLPSKDHQYALFPYDALVVDCLGLLCALNLIVTTIKALRKSPSSLA